MEQVDIILTGPENNRSCKLCLKMFHKSPRKSNKFISFLMINQLLSSKPVCWRAARVACSLWGGEELRRPWLPTFRARLRLSAASSDIGMSRGGDDHCPVLIANYVCKQTCCKFCFNTSRVTKDTDMKILLARLNIIIQHLKFCFSHGSLKILDRQLFSNSMRFLVPVYLHVSNLNGAKTICFKQSWAHAFLGLYSWAEPFAHFLGPINVLTVVFSLVFNRY